MVILASSSPAVNNNEGDEGWQRVKGRKGNSSTEPYDEVNAMQGSSVAEINADESAMTIYITNFPFQISKKEIWDRSSAWGTVVDVFIANRRSKAGKPFGFVRFIKVANAEKLIDGLRSIWFDNLRMFADIEKYPRKKFQKLMQSKSATTKPDCSRNPSPTWKAKDVVNSSYAEVLSGAKGNMNSSSSKRRTVRIYSNDTDPVNKFSHDLLLKIKEPHNIPYVRQWFHAEGFVDIDISYVGGRWIYVIFTSPEAKDQFLSNESIRHKFGSVKAPCDNFVPDERMVWVEISGIPKGAWFESNFQVVLGSWGKCIFVASEWGEACSMGKVCVLTQSANFIYEELNAVLDEKSYDIWIREFAVWEPDILQISSPVTDSANGLDLEVSPEGNYESDDSSASSASFESDLCKDHSVGDRGNDVVKVNADVILENNHNTCIPEVAEELSSFDRCKEERSAHHNNGLDDHDVFLLNRLLHQDKCWVRPVKATVNENIKASNESSLKQDQSINESTGSGNQKKVGDHLFSSVVSPSTPPVTNLNLAEHSSSTWLDYVGPIITDELDPEKCWSYKDPSGNVQGPFSLVELHKWKDHFPSNFKIWRIHGKVKEKILLRSAFKRRTKDVG